MSNGVLLSRRAAERVAAVVRAFEREPQRNGSGGGATRWPSSPLVYVRVTSAATGGGKYNGVLVLPPDAPPDDTSNLAEADLGTNTSVPCLILNPMEVGAATHQLPLGVYVGRVIQRIAGPPERLVVVVMGGAAFGPGGQYQCLMTIDGEIVWNYPRFTD